jgi:hypothetical protein
MSIFRNILLKGIKNQLAAGFKKEGYTAEIKNFSCDIDKINGIANFNINNGEKLISKPLSQFSDFFNLLENKICEKTKNISDIVRVILTIDFETNKVDSSVFCTLDGKKTNLLIEDTF